MWKRGGRFVRGGGSFYLFIYFFPSLAYNHVDKKICAAPTMPPARDLLSRPDEGGAPAAINHRHPFFQARRTSHTHDDHAAADVEGAGAPATAPPAAAAAAADGEFDHADDEHVHYSHRAPWLRAVVLGANDGLVSTASLMLGVAGGE